MSVGCKSILQLCMSYICSTAPLIFHSWKSCDHTRNTIGSQNKHTQHGDSRCKSQCFFRSFSNKMLNVLTQHAKYWQTEDLVLIFWNKCMNLFRTWQITSYNSGQNQQPASLYVDVIYSLVHLNIPNSAVGSPQYRVIYTYKFNNYR